MPDAAPPTPDGDYRAGPSVPAVAALPVAVPARPVDGEVRIVCHQHNLCLWSGSSEPDGGAEAVAAAAGCPAWTPLPAGQVAHDPALFDGCPAARAAAQ